MEEVEPPECPVCLQTYDAVSAIPRVLPCGHTTCEVCLKHLPNPFPNTIRCTVCTLLVKFPPSISSLPKNLDLLHFSYALQRRQPPKDKTGISPSPSNGKNQSVLFPFTPKLWSYEFYSKWKKWVLPEDCIMIGSGKVLKSYESDYLMGCSLREEQNVGLVKVGIFNESEEDCKVFKCSYESRIVCVLCGMKEEKRGELELILKATHKVNHLGKSYGFWYSKDDKCVYMVWEKFTSSNLMKNEDSYSDDGMSGLGILGMEICEILSGLHSEGMILGFVSVNCFGFNDFGHVCIDVSEILNTGRKVVQRAHKDLVFISPEMLSDFLVNEGSEFDKSRTIYELGCGSDVWLLGCVLVSLILGSSFVKEMESYFQFVTNVAKDEKVCDYTTLYVNWIEKVEVLLEGGLESRHASIREILCRCLAFDPKRRPLLTEVWKCLRELVFKPRFDIRLGLKMEVKKDKFVVVGGMYAMLEESEKESMDVESSTNGDIVEGVSRGRIKCIEMKGHLDCITGLAIGGEFLFSCSYDKVVHVWSLQDFTRMHSFKGHNNRVMAIVYVDAEQPLCISGDNEGVVCVWKASVPFSEEPNHKLYEVKDWRYSGIHAMTNSGAEFLYTGSGDKSIKAWSLQDYTLSCAMNGHKSVVTSLTVCDGVLYSGSRDGTVRLWSLSDHSPLTVLGEDIPGIVQPIISLHASDQALCAGHSDGIVRIWRNDVLLKSTQTHEGATLSLSKNGKWLFSAGWDKTIHVQEISENDDGLDVVPVGSIACNSILITLVYWQGKLIVGQADGVVKVYRGA